MEKVPADKKSDATAIDKAIRSHCKGLKAKEGKLVRFRLMSHMP